jgi:hypothetical protein
MDKKTEDERVFTIAFAMIGASDQEAQGRRGATKPVM